MERGNVIYLQDRFPERDDEPLLTKQELAARLSVHPRTITRWMKRMPEGLCVKPWPQARPRFRYSRVLRWLEQGAKDPQRSRQVG